MRVLKDVQFIPATGQPEYAVIPYSVYLELKERPESVKSNPVQLHRTKEKNQGMNPIKEARISQGLSQAALAQSAQISVPYLSQLEHNLRVGSKAVLLRLAQALNVAIDQIL